MQQSDACGAHGGWGGGGGGGGGGCMWVTQQLRYKLILNVHGATKRKSVEHSSVQYTLQIGARQDHLRGSFTVHTTNKSTSRSPQRVFHSQPDSVHPYSQKEPLRKALQMLSRWVWPWSRALQMLSNTNLTEMASQMLPSTNMTEITSQIPMGTNLIEIASQIPMGTNLTEIASQMLQSTNLTEIATLMLPSTNLTEITSQIPTGTNLTDCIANVVEH